MRFTDGYDVKATLVQFTDKAPGPATKSEVFTHQKLCRYRVSVIGSGHVDDYENQRGVSCMMANPLILVPGTLLRSPHHGLAIARHHMQVISS